MNYKENYYNYIQYVKVLCLKGERPSTKVEWRRWKKHGDKRYFEFHHIVPICIGGEDVDSNKIALTNREHYLAHYLLTKIYAEDKTQLYKLLYAFIRQTILINPETHENRRDSFLSKKQSVLYGKLVAEIKPALGHRLNSEQLERLSKGRSGIPSKRKGVSWNEEFGIERASLMRKKVGDATRKRPPLTEEQRSHYGKHCIGRVPKNAKKVQCTETGETFLCMKHAYTKYNITKREFLKAIKGDGCCGGLHWRIV